jgi:hypothetical protein
VVDCSNFAVTVVPLKSLLAFAARTQFEH